MTYEELDKFDEAFKAFKDTAKARSKSIQTLIDMVKHYKNQKAKLKS